MPEDAVYVGRPSPWGNPFPVNGDRATWMALALGQHGNEAGRRAAAILAYRAWMTGTRLPIPVAPPDDGLGDIEFSDGSTRRIADIPAAMGVLMLSQMGPFVLPPKPDLAPLRGRDLACWCPLNQPCHADVLLEIIRERE
jgi:Domain of unknown function (DUF4326)